MEIRIVADGLLCVRSWFTRLTCANPSASHNSSSEVSIVPLLFPQIRKLRSHGSYKWLSWDLNPGTRVYAMPFPPHPGGGHPAHFAVRETGIHSLSHRSHMRGQKGELKLGCLLPVLHVAPPPSAALRTRPHGMSGLSSGGPGRGGTHLRHKNEGVSKTLSHQSK